MIKQILSAITFAGLALGLSTSVANAGYLVNQYGYGDKYYDICNETDDSYVTFFTDETNIEHGLYTGECISIWTNYDYIVIDYDESWKPGDQLDTVRVNYPNDINFVTWSYDNYGEVIGTQQH